MPDKENSVIYLRKMDIYEMYREKCMNQIISKSFTLFKICVKRRRRKNKYKAFIMKQQFSGVVLFRLLLYWESLLFLLEDIMRAVS